MRVASPRGTIPETAMRTSPRSSLSSAWSRLRAVFAAFLCLFALNATGPAFAGGGEMRAAPPMEESGWMPALPQNWTTLDAASIHIHGVARDSEQLRRLAAHADESLPRLAAALGVPIGQDIHVYLADTEERFRTLQPGAVPEWADGTAWPGSGSIFLHGPRARSGVARPLAQVLDHELVHVLLGRALAPKPVPAWLQEGTAQILAREVGPDLPERIGRGMARGGLPTFEELEHGFPHDASRADLAYAMSASLVQHIQLDGGQGALPALVREVAKGQPLRAAVQTVTGKPLPQIETAWRARWWAWLPAWLIGSQLADALFVVTALALAVGGARTLWTRGHAMSGWREEGAALRRIAWELASWRTLGG